jgi:GNAT superfamily N-acetyltransferase
VKSDVEIRIASPDESEKIAAVLREAFAEFESLYTPEAFAVTILDSGEIRKRFDEGAIWAALRNETLVGTVSTVAEGERLYIRSMAILPSAQGFGIGRRLLKTIEDFAIENEFKTLFLYTTPFLLDAIRLYEQNGFERTDEKASADEFFGTPWFVMEKKLI